MVNISERKTSERLSNGHTLPSTVKIDTCPQSQIVKIYVQIMKVVYTYFTEIIQVFFDVSMKVTSAHD